MTGRYIDGRRRVKMLTALLCCGAFTLSLLGDCDDRVAVVTQYFDPCGTIFANCQPGDFQVDAADVGDYCVDPACTVPGQCNPQQPLGTITDICP